MISSSFCELHLRQDASKLLALEVGADELPYVHPESLRLAANRSIVLTLRRGKSTPVLRVLLGNEEKFVFQKERREWTLQLSEWLRNQYGKVDLRIEAQGAIGERWTPVLTLTITIEADPSFQRLHESLVAELEEVDSALAVDVTGPVWHRPGGGSAARTLRAETDLLRLREIYERLDRAISRIGKKPTRTLRRERVLGRWRPGDVLGTAAVHRLAGDGRIGRDRSGRLTAPRTVLLDRPRLATDIEEHRHVRAGVVRLAERLEAIAQYCGRAISLLREEEGRWSEDALRKKIEPKVYTLALTREHAHDLQGRVRALVEKYPFIGEAGTPRTPFGPSPLFLGRPAYREAYRALLDSRRYLGGRYGAAEGSRVRFRSLATLYEYWVFVRVVGILRDLYGPPLNSQAFSLIDEFYRPELTPGQQFRFRLPHGDSLTATYEPDFPPVSSRSRERYRSALTSAPLRPDVTLELSMPGRLPNVLALDAKSGHIAPEKTRDRLMSAAHYIALIHDPLTGHQPVRQLFLVHRDIEAGSVCTVSGYLEGRVSPTDARILGAVPAQPGNIDSLRNVILRFLETFRARKWR